MPMFYVAAASPDVRGGDPAARSDRRARTSPKTNTPAATVAPTDSFLPMAFQLPTLATTSIESLAAPIAVHRSHRRPLLEASTVPTPRTRSRIPIVRRSKTDAPVGGSRLESRRKASGKRTGAHPRWIEADPSADP